MSTDERNREIDEDISDVSASPHHAHRDRDDPDPRVVEPEDAGWGAAAKPAHAQEDDPSAGALERLDRQASDDDDPEVRRSEVVDIVATTVATIMEVQQESFSGLVPHPEHWDKYDPQTRERILRMSEAYTTDESSRRDRMVDSTISETGKGRRAATALAWGSFICAFGSYALFENVVLSGLFLAFPVTNLIGDFLPERLRRREDPNKGNGNGGNSEGSA